MTYKSKTVLLILLLTGCARCFSQTAVDLSVGAAASWQVSRIGGQRYSTHALIGPCAFAALEIPFGTQWAIQPGAGFIQKGGSYPSDYFGAGTGGQSVRVNELELSVRLKYKLTTGPLGWYLALGPYAGFLLSEKTRINGTVINNADNYRTAEFGLNGGPGLETHCKSALFFVEARYMLGLSPANDDAASPVSDNVTLQSVGLTVGFKFPLGSKKG